MRIKDLFEKWGLTGLKVKTPILEMDWEPSDPDKNAAQGSLWGSGLVLTHSMWVSCGNSSPASTRISRCTLPSDFPRWWLHIDRAIIHHSQLSAATSAYTTVQ